MKCYFIQRKHVDKVYKSVVGLLSDIEKVRVANIINISLLLIPTCHFVKGCAFLCAEEASFLYGVYPKTPFYTKWCIIQWPLRVQCPA